jgi:hypothetical protein
VADLLHFSRQVPLVTADRRMNLAPLVAARQGLAQRPGWCALFTKAFAVVAARRPELRRAYMPFPWPHVYEHGRSVAAITVERQFENEEVPFVAHVHGPEKYGLLELDAYLRRCKNEPLTSNASFRRTLRLGRLPWPLRRLAWWLGLKASGRQRARYFGTFVVTSTAAHGAGMLHLLTPLTIALHYGLFDAAGNLDVRLTFDHRVLDGAPMARALADMERVLLHDILAELRGLATAQAA